MCNSVSFRKVDPIRGSHPHPSSSSTGSTGRILKQDIRELHAARARIVVRCLLRPTHSGQGLYAASLWACLPCSTTPAAVEPNPLHMHAAAPSAALWWTQDNQK